MQWIIGRKACCSSTNYGVSIYLYLWSSAAVNTQKRRVWVSLHIITSFIKSEKETEKCWHQRRERERKRDRQQADTFIKDNRAFSYLFLFSHLIFSIILISSPLYFSSLFHMRWSSTATVNFLITSFSI